MPLNKEALIRYRVINRCLIELKYVSKDRLIEACEDALGIVPIGQRTIYQDICDMRNDTRLGYFAPICFDKIYRAYYYSDPEYSIDKVPVSSEELKALSFAATMLSQYKGVEVFDTFSGAVQKIVNTLNIHRLQDELPVLPFVEFETAHAAGGSEYIETIIKAIRAKKPLEVKYKRFGSETVAVHIIHPYLLKEYRNRWYLIGLHQGHNSMGTYCLDRVVDMSIAHYHEFRNCSFDPKVFYRNSIGIIVSEAEAVEVKLLFSKNQSNYVITQPIHCSQKVNILPDGSAEVNLLVAVTYELINMILGWGGEVKVLSPDELIILILEKHKQAISLY